MNVQVKKLLMIAALCTLLLLVITCYRSTKTTTQIPFNAKLWNDSLGDYKMNGVRQQMRLSILSRYGLGTKMSEIRGELGKAQREGNVEILSPGTRSGLPKEGTQCLVYTIYIDKEFDAEEILFLFNKNQSLIYRESGIW